MGEPIIKQLDRVELITTKSVSYMASKPGHSPSPHGKWTVVGIIEGRDIIASKDEALIRIPLSDVRKVESYDVNKVIDGLRKVHKSGKKEDPQKHFEVGPSNS